MPDASAVVVLLPQTVRSVVVSLFSVFGLRFAVLHRGPNTVWPGASAAVVL